DALGLQLAQVVGGLTDEQDLSAARLAVEETAEARVPCGQTLRRGEVDVDQRDHLVDLIAPEVNVSREAGQHARVVHQAVGEYVASLGLQIRIAAGESGDLAVRRRVTAVQRHELAQRGVVRGRRGPRRR